MGDAPHCPKRTVLFRLEFGGTSGWGHLVRSGALAAELVHRGWTCSLWTSSPVESVSQEMRGPFERIFPFDERSTDALDPCTWLVVDHYDTGDAVLRRWRANHHGKILVIDDEARRHLDAADLVLNVRPGLATSPYAPGRATLLGERFALLRRELSEPVMPSWTPAAGAMPVLVMMGGTDPAGATAAALEALADVDATHLVPVVVRAGVAAPMGADAAAFRHFASAVWLGGVNARELAGWAAVCRFAVSAAGGTLYELAALRLPFVSVVVAENQRVFAAEIEARWGMPRVLAGAGLRGDLAATARALVVRLGAGQPPVDAFAAIDGRGAARVADAMEG